jgi:hypothetical protein
MAEVTLSYPDDQTERIVEAVCTRFGYQATVEVDGELVDNPESDVQFVARQLAEWVKHQVRVHEEDKAARLAEETIGAEVDAIDVVVG